MRRTRLPFVTLLSLAACTTEESAESAAPAADLAERLGAGQVRAGVITSTDALFGGISAEGAPGDVKLYNGNVRFVIEAVGDSDYYIDYGGNLIDADIVRPEGQPGRDFLDELAPMVSFGRVVDATNVEVVDDGSEGTAHVRVSGPGAPMRLITGALESPGAVPDYDLTVTTDYVLRPDAWSVEVTTTVQNDDSKAFSADIGLFALYGQEVAQLWHPRTGYADADKAPVAMEAMVGTHGEGVVALMAGEGELTPSAVGELISGMAAGATAFSTTQSVAPGESASFTQRVGVAPDLATLETERLAREGVDAATVSGTVTAGGVGVAGAMVHTLAADGGPVTVAKTDADGRFSLPTHGATDLVATGRGTGITVDIPAGHGNVSPYDRSRDGVLDSLTNGAVPIAFDDGYGISPTAATSAPALALSAPGRLALHVADGGPAAVIVDFAAGDPVSGDARLVPGRPGGHAALAFVADGAMELPLEPGDYVVTVHRGVRTEVDVQSVTVVSGETTSVEATIVPAYSAPGVLTIDPHEHAAPSGDGSIPMEDRLLVAAGNGIDVHVGTDHDHVADYRPALAALGLQPWLQSIVADEVSPVLRGHFNAYPAKNDGRPNGGAPRWWQKLETTSELFAWVRETVGEEGIIQANHPVGSSGVFSYADYEPASGTIGDADKWGDDFDAMELLNSDEYVDYLPYYLDLAARGVGVTPVGVSDSHSWTGGNPGLNLTFLHTGGTLGEFGPDALKAAMAARGTVVSHGPYIEATVGGAWAPGTIVSPGQLDVRVLAPTWIPVQSVSLWRDGVLAETASCHGAAPTWCSVSFDLPADADASWVVVAESTTAPITAVWPGQLAWAATSAIFTDIAADGWTAPLPPLVKL